MYAQMCKPSTQCNACSVALRDKQHPFPTPSAEAGRSSFLLAALVSSFSLSKRQLHPLLSLYVSLCSSLLSPFLPYFHNPLNKYPTSLCMACLSMSLSLAHRVVPCPGPAAFGDMWHGLVTCLFFRLLPTMRRSA